MSPILLRPVREQLEHDRIIRLLQAKWKRKYQVGMNVGAETSAAIGSGTSPAYPDLILTAAGARKPEILIEVETAESVNKMEAMFEWGRFAQERASFHLYVPVGSVDAVRRLCHDNSIVVNEIWTYDAIGNQTRFTQVLKASSAGRPSHRGAPHHATDTKAPAKGHKPPAKPASSKPAKKAPAKAAPAGRSTPAAKKSSAPAKAGKSVAKAVAPRSKGGAPAKGKHR